MSEKDFIKPKQEKESSPRLEEKSFGKAEAIQREEKPETEKAETSEKTIRENAELEDFDINLVSDINTQKEAKPAKKTSGKTAKNFSEETKLKSVSETKRRKRSIVKPVPKTLVKRTASDAKKANKESVEITALTKAAETELREETSATLLSKEESPIFRELAEPKLPALSQENRARLQMQSPTKIFFYWSIKNNPFETLKRAFGNRAQNYTLIAKLQNLTKQTEEIFPAKASDSSWFDVESDSTYRAEIGFFAPRRPFIHLMFSNTIETPRSAPSPLRDWSQKFTVTAERFAEVLDVSGYVQDAFEVALAGDDVEKADHATQNAFTQLIGKREFESKASELRFVLFALASGAKLSDLREQISRKLLGEMEMILRENAETLSTENILSALEENFGFAEFETAEDAPEFSQEIFGASAINFRKFPRNFLKRFAPVSSLRFVSSRF